MNSIVKSTSVVLAPEVVHSLLIGGDLSKLSAEQKVEYIKYRCQSLSLDPAAKPFELLQLNGKQILYATKSCTEQLCESRKLSVSLGMTEQIEDVVQVTAKVSDGTRSTENVGCVGIGNLKGEALANALMKARTKAIRRTVLAHCGLGMMDELEVETIPNAIKLEPMPQTPPESVVPPATVVTETQQLPGDFVLPFGADKGKKIRELTGGQIKAKIKYCVERGVYSEILNKLQAYLKDGDMLIDIEPDKKETNEYLAQINKADKKELDRLGGEIAGRGMEGTLANGVVNYLINVINQRKAA